MYELPQFLSKREVASFLGVSNATVDRMLKDGTLPAAKLGRGQSAPVRIHRDAVLKLTGLASGRQVRRAANAAEREFHEAMLAIGGAE